MESKCFYFSGHETADYFTHKFEIRGDGKVFFREIGDEETQLAFITTKEEIKKFAEFLENISL
jgi:hypothetical protein